MKNSLLFGALTFISFQAISATTVTVATPGHPINNPLKQESITSSQIDSFIGGNSATQLTDGLFADIAELNSDIESEIRTLLFDNPKTKSVEWVDANIDPIYAKLTQESTSVSLSISGMSVRFKAKADGKPVLCPTVTYTAEINGIKAAGVYDAYTGILQGPNLTHESLDVTNASCSGIIGAIVDIFGIADDFVETELNKAVKGLEGLSYLHEVFSVRSLVDKLLQVVFNQEQTETALVAIDNLVHQTDLNSGIVVDVKIDPRNYTSQNNAVTLTASHERPQVSAEYLPSMTTLVYVEADNVEKYDIYRQLQGTTIWEHILTTPYVINYVQAPPGAKIMAVATNDLIPGLKSFPIEVEVLQTATCDPVCGFNP